MNQLNIKVLILVCLSFTVFQMSCGPREVPPQQDLGFFPLGEVKDYLYYQPGSYWIYENQTSKIRDTVIVSGVLLDTLSDHSEVRTYTFEYLEYNLISTYKKYRYSCYMQPINADVLNWRYGFKFWIEKYNNNGYEGIINPFYYNMPDADYIGGSGSHNTYFRGKDTLTVNGKLYADVLHFEIDRDGIYPAPITGGIETSYYWAKGYGLIKYEAHEKKLPYYDQWILVESDLIK